jgi:carbamoyl-phosphate synthase large subunit
VQSSSLKPLKILLTACGCPGASTLIKMLKLNGERSIQIVGTDMDSEAIGRFFCESFYQVPSGSSPNYISEITKIIKREQPDIVFPESSNEVIPLAEAKRELEALGTKVVVSSPEALLVATNKYLMYETLREKTQLPLPNYSSVTTYDEFVSTIYDLGYPKNPVVFKPHIGKGSRGVRILDPNANRLSQLLDQKPISKFMSLDELREIFQNIETPNFPQLVVMEYLEGMEKTTDSIALNGRELVTTVKTVERARWGVIVNGELVQDEDLINQTRAILKAIPLSYCVNIQFIAGKLIEINPRVSSFIYQDDFIPPYLAIKLALGEIDEEQVTSYQDKVDYGRRMVRYMDQVFHKGGCRLL